MTRRRANGEGSSYQRSDGRWVATARDANGKRVEFYGRTQREAMGKRKDAAQRLTTGAPVVDSKTRLSTIFDGWRGPRMLNANGTKVLALNTQEQYRNLLRVHVMPTLGGKPIGTIRRSDIAELLETKAGELADSSRHALLAAISALFNYAMRDDLIAANPARGVAWPTVPPTKSIAVEEDELRAFLMAAKGERLEALFLFIAGTGVRRGEALGLRWADVQNDAVHIQHSVSRINRVGLVDGPPKGNRDRWVRLSPELAAVLASHRARQAAERLAAGHAWYQEDRVFCSEVGTVMDPRNVNRVMARLVRKAGIKATPHTLRHTAATSLLEQGHHSAVVAEMIGNSQRVLLETYSHARPTASKAAADALGKLLNM